MKWAGELFLPEMGVDIGVRSPRSIVGPSLVFEFAGNVENGPSRTERFDGGRPRSLPVNAPPLLGHADDTAGPCLRRERLLLEGVIADCGSGNAESREWLIEGVIAD